jgi:3-methyladenine DNA glycosylase Mpg
MYVRLCISPIGWSNDDLPAPRRCGLIVGLDGLDLCREGPLWLGRGDLEPGEIGQSIRIGIARDANRLLRFYLRGSPFVSGPRSLRV